MIWSSSWRTLRTTLKPAFVYDLLLVTSGRLATIAAQLAFVKLYTNLFSTSELGFYFYWQTISYSMSALIFVPLDQFQQVNIHHYRTSNITLKSFVPLNLIPIGILLTIGAIISLFGSLYTHKVLSAPFYAVTLAVTVHLSSALRNACNNLGHRRLAVIFSLLDVIFRLIFLFLIAHFFSIPSTAILLTTSLAGALVALSILPFFSRLNMWGGGSFQSPSIAAFLHFAWPITVGAGLTWLQVQSSRFLVPLGFAEAIGIFATVSAIGSAGMQAATSIFQMMFMPEVYRSFGQSLTKYVVLGGAMIVFVLSVSAAIAPYLVRALTKEAFIPYAYCLLFGGIVEAGNFFVGALGVYMQIHHKTIYGLIMGLIGFVTSIGLLIALYYFGIISPWTIGIATAFSQFMVVMSCFTIYFWMKRQYKEQDAILHARWVKARQV